MLAAIKEQAKCQNSEKEEVKEEYGGDPWPGEVLLLPRRIAGVDLRTQAGPHRCTEAQVQLLLRNTSWYIKLIGNPIKIAPNAFVCL